MLDTMKSFTYTRILPYLKKPPALQADLSAGEDKQPIAMICDEMTWQNLRREHPVAYLDPRRWRETLEQYKPALFFCEAAWQPPWRAQIYKDMRVRYENRRTLLQILDYCQSSGIPTVFWAKEDPAYFKHAVYDFTDTALRFDHLLTTAEECVPAYEALGHKSVHSWMFGFSESIFYPPDSVAEAEREDTAVFAGSWYPDQPQRCEDTIAVFNYVLAKGIPLRIYDRYSGRSANRFPERYRAYVHNAVPYEDLGDMYRRSRYVININTVKDSQTMFARRVYEAMACGCIIISNESLAMREQYSDKVWFAGTPFGGECEHDIRVENINEVFCKHTNGERMEQLWEIVNKSA